MAPTERQKQLHLMLSDAEDSMLRALAEADGFSASDVVRQMIRKAFIERWNPDALEAARKPQAAAKGTKARR
jgi:hypothetical protein